MAAIFRRFEAKKKQTAPNIPQVSVLSVLSVRSSAPCVILTPSRYHSPSKFLLFPIVGYIYNFLPPGGAMDVWIDVSLIPSLAVCVHFGFPHSHRFNRIHGERVRTTNRESIPRFDAPNGVHESFFWGRPFPFFP